MNKNTPTVDLTKITINQEVNPKEVQVSRHNRINHHKLMEILNMENPHIHVTLNSSRYNEPLKWVVRDFSKTWMKLLTTKTFEKWEKVELFFTFNWRTIRIKEAEVRWSDKENNYHTLWLKFNKIKEDWKLPRISDLLSVLSKFNFVLENSNKTTIKKGHIREELEESFFDEITIKNDISERVSKIFLNNKIASTSDVSETLIMLLYKKAKISSDRLSMWVSLPLPENKEHVDSILKAIYVFLQSINIQLIPEKDKKEKVDILEKFLFKAESSLIDNEEILLWENLIDEGATRKVYLKKWVSSDWKKVITLIIKWAEPINQEINKINTYGFNLESAIPHKSLEGLNLEDISKFPSVRKWDILLWFEGFVSWANWVDCFGFVIPPKKINQTPNIKIVSGVEMKSQVKNNKEYIYFVALNDWIMLCKKSAKNSSITHIWVNEKMWIKVVNLKKDEKMVLESNTWLKSDYMSWDFDIKWTWDIEVTESFEWSIKTWWSFTAWSVDDNTSIQAEKEVKILWKIWSKVTISSNENVFLPSWIFPEITVSWKEVRWIDIWVLGTTIIEWNKIKLINFKADGKIIIKLWLWDILRKREDLIKKNRKLESLSAKTIEANINLFIEKITSLLENKLNKDQYIEDINNIKLFLRAGKKEEACDLFELILGRLSPEHRWNVILRQYAQEIPKDNNITSIPMIANQAITYFRTERKRIEYSDELIKLNEIIDNWIFFSIDWVLSPNSSIEIRYWKNKSRMLSWLSWTASRNIPISNIFVYKYDENGSDLIKKEWSFWQE